MVCMHICACMYAHVCIHGGCPPPPTKYFKAQLLLQAKLRLMCFYAKANIYPMQSKCKIHGVTPTPQTPIKNFNAQCLLQGKIWYIMFSDAKPHMYPMQRQCKHINMFTEGTICQHLSFNAQQNPRQSQLQRTKAYLCKYVMWYEHINIRHTYTYVYLTHKTWQHNLECLVIILTQCQSNYYKSSHLWITH